MEEPVGGLGIDCPSAHLSILFYLTHMREVAIWQGSLCLTDKYSATLEGCCGDMWPTPTLKKHRV